MAFLYWSVVQGVGQPVLAVGSVAITWNMIVSIVVFAAAFGVLKAKVDAALRAAEKAFEKAEAAEKSSGRVELMVAEIKGELSVNRRQRLHEQAESD